MSVTTTADENLNRFEDILGESISLMSEIVVNRCWGWDEFTKETQDKHLKILNQLIEIRTLLE